MERYFHRFIFAPALSGLGFPAIGWPSDASHLPAHRQTEDTAKVWQYARTLLFQNRSAPILISDRHLVLYVQHFHEPTDYAHLALPHDGDAALHQSDWLWNNVFSRTFSARAIASTLSIVGLRCALSMPLTYLRVRPALVPSASCERPNSRRRRLMLRAKNFYCSAWPASYTTKGWTRKQATERVAGRRTALYLAASLPLDPHSRNRVREKPPPSKPGGFLFGRGWIVHAQSPSAGPFGPSTDQTITESSTDQRGGAQGVRRVCADNG